MDRLATVVGRLVGWKKPLLSFPVGWTYTAKTQGGTPWEFLSWTRTGWWTSGNPRSAMYPAGIQLYIQTGSQVKGGIALPVYHCARGSTSLVSFHRHLKDFIPGTFHPLALLLVYFFHLNVLFHVCTWKPIFPLLTNFIPFLVSLQVQLLATFTFRHTSWKVL